MKLTEYESLASTITKLEATVHKYSQLPQKDIHDLIISNNRLVEEIHCSHKLKSLEKEFETVSKTCLSYKDLFGRSQAWEKEYNKLLATHHEERDRYIGRLLDRDKQIRELKDKVKLLKLQLKEAKRGRQ